MEEFITLAIFFYFLEGSIYRGEVVVSAPHVVIRV